MKNSFQRVIVGLFGLSLASTAFASQTPGSGSVTGNTITTISASVTNSASSPNPTNSLYYFEATTGGPSDTADTAGGTVVLVGIQYFGSGVSGDTISGTIQPVVGGTSYNIYVKACPPGAAQTDFQCSSWVSLGAVTTASYPGNPGFQNVASGDTAPRQFTARATSVQDANNIVAWQLMVNNNDTGLGAGSSALLTQQPFTGQFSGNGSYLITSAQYAGLLPNRGYTATEHLIYFYNKTGPDTTIGQFFTQPVNPVPGTISAVTHCSATLSYANAGVTPANPSDSPYLINVGGVVTGGSATQTKNIGGSGAAGDTNSVTFTNLNFFTDYNPTVQALNRGGGSWLPSTAVPYSPGFKTQDWGVITIQSFTSNTITLDTSGIIGGGTITSWSVATTPPLSSSPSGAGQPPATIVLNVTPNTSYQVRITLAEGGASCSSTLIVGTRVTPAVVPTGFTFSATGPRALLASWSDGVNGAGTTYLVKYCTNADMVTGCLTQSASGLSTAITTGVVPQTTYHAQVQAVAVSGGTSSAFIPVPAAIATTPNEAPVVSAVNVTVNVVSATLSATATDNGGPTHLVYHWAVTSSPSGSVFSFTSNDTTGASATTDLNFNTSGNYAGTLTVTDADGTGLATTVTWNTNPAAPVATKVAISPSAPTVITGFTQVFTAYVCDQFESGACSSASTHLIAGQSVNWTLSGGGTLSTGAGTSTTFTAVTPSLGTPWNLTATVNGHTASAQITVTAAGPVADSISFSMAPTTKGGTATVVGHDNVAHIINHNWSGSDTGITFTPSTGQSADGVAFNTVVVFPKAGTFTLTDNLGSGVTISTTIVVPQILSGVKVCLPGGDCPSAITLKTLQNQQFTATGLDQFGNSMNLSNVVWTSNGGSISGAGNFSSSAIGQSVLVRATDPITGKSGLLTVNLVSFDVSGAKAYPVPYKASFNNGGIIHFTGLGSQATLHIYTTTGKRILDYQSTADTYDWPVKNSSGESLASGVYFYMIESPDGKKNGKLIIIQ